MASLATWFSSGEKDGKTEAPVSIDDYSPVKKDVVALGETNPGGVMASATEAEMIMFESKVEATDSEAQENPWALMILGALQMLESQSFLCVQESGNPLGTQLYSRPY